jgi:hypothetical protein
VFEKLYLNFVLQGIISTFRITFFIHFKYWQKCTLNWHLSWPQRSFTHVFKIILCCLECFRTNVINKRLPNSIVETEKFAVKEIEPSPLHYLISFRCKIGAVSTYCDPSITTHTFFRFLCYTWWFFSVLSLRLFTTSREKWNEILESFKFALSRLAKARTTGIANNQCKTHWKFLFSVTKLPKVFKWGIMQSELLEQFLGGVV